jgi:hypothetical protein
LTTHLIFLKVFFDFFSKPQLQLSELSDRQKGKILSELLVSSIHLHSHCDEDWQNLIADELETLADD